MKIKHIVIHCSDTPSDRNHSAADIHAWHLANGWAGIGYNEVIDRNGDVQHGRPPYWIGAHVRDFDGNGVGHNSDSIGICLIGRDQFTDGQFDSLTAVIGHYLDIYPSAEVVGHYQLDSRKTCPNFNVTEWWYGVTKPKTTRNYLP